MRSAWLHCEPVSRSSSSLAASQTRIFMCTARQCADFSVRICDVHWRGVCLVRPSPRLSDTCGRLALRPVVVSGWQGRGTGGLGMFKRAVLLFMAIGFGLGR
jgi:hypothetical protein